MASVEYGFEVEAAHKGCSAVIRNKNCSNGSFVTKKYVECETLYDNFQRGLKLNPNGPCMGYRPLDAEGKALPFKFFTFTEIWQRIQNFASGLLYLDLVPKLCILGIYAHNCVEWGLSEQTCNSYSFTLCPIYDTLTQDSVDFIFKQTQMKTCICGSNETFKVLSNIEKYESLKAIVQIGDVSKKDYDIARDCGVIIYTFKEIEEVGANHPHAPIVPTPEDIHTICYTSGTTGMPKGALISHKAFCSNMYACLMQGIEGCTQDSYLSYLPMAHVLERLVQNLVLNCGGKVGYYQGSTKTLVDDLKAFRPTVFVSVPRLLTRIYDTVLKQVEKSSYISQYLFHAALSAKTEGLKQGYYYNRLWDTLVFNNIKTSIGLDKCWLILSGSAPLPPECMTFLRCLISDSVCEGYGATEICGCSLLQARNDFTIGNVGGPTTACEIKLVDVPEMGYLTTDREHNGQLCIARGEVLFRGPLLFSGYYKNPEETKAAIDEEGWYHTGDVAVLLPNYAIKIVDRKKNFFKLSQGEYVAAEKLELIYSQCKYISQVLIYGDSSRNYLIAIVVPDKHSVMDWYKQTTGNESDFKTICQSKELKDLIQNDFNRIQKENQLRGIEKVKNLVIDSEPWSVENDLLTPTFKLKRNAVQKKYFDKIQEAYKA
ncbi:hypothetical protein WA158_005024 [Blastocystis sp. Blastoise]